MDILNTKTSKRYLFSNYAPVFMFITIFLSLIIRFIFYTKANLIVEETYYWNYAAHLDIGYLDHPPMVALLIFLSTKLLGLHEFTVRLPALICWMGTAYYLYKLTEKMSEGAGIYSVLLISIMPCFLIQSLIISPDEPLLFCWSATLFYLYLALIEEKTSAWYRVGLWFGLGMVSKYTMGLLIPATLFYMLTNKATRQHFLKKEPYLAAFISLIIFSPVIYWNASHHWASFAFQSVNRFSDDVYFFLPNYFLYIFIFTTHLGIYGLFQLFKRKETNTLNSFAHRFIIAFSILPLMFFAYISLKHIIKINWMIPALIALLPWFAHLIKTSNSAHFVNYRNSWLVTGLCLLVTYSVFLSYVLNDVPDLHLKNLLVNNLSWQKLVKEITKIAEKTEKKYKSAPILVGLDRYYINSEVSFYQSLFSSQKSMKKTYPVIGRHIFNKKSLMYEYWYSETLPKSTIVILITKHKDYFTMPMILNNTTQLTKSQLIQAISQGGGKNIQKYYYQIVKTHSPLNEKANLS